MADLQTSYLGLTLKNPIVCAASPITKALDTAKEAEDAGASAFVMYSLFEEQIDHEKHELDHFLEWGSDSFAEALDYFPEPQDFNNIDAEDYLEHLRKLKQSLSVPVIASLNGVSNGGWTRYAKYMEEAGADALELNVFYVPTDLSLSSSEVEDMYLQTLKQVKESVSIPVALKVGASFTAFANFAKRADDLGADGLVLFNRFFGPDIDLDEREVVAKLRLSKRIEMHVPLRWIAVLYGNVQADLAATSGIHTAQDVIKMTMAGASVSMVASILLANGSSYLTTMLREMMRWMDEHEFESVEQMKGSMSYQHVAQPAAYERANYMKILQSYSPLQPL